MAYGVMAHQNNFPQSATFGPTSNATPPMARMFGTNNTNVTTNANAQPKAYAVPVNSGNQSQAVHVAGLGNHSLERSPGGAHLHAGPASSGNGRSSGNALPFSHSADLRFHSLAFQPSPTNAPSPPVTRAVSNMRTPSPNPANQTQPVYQPVPQRVGGGAGGRSGTSSPIGAAATTPMSLPPTSPPAASPGASPATAAPPRLNRVSETPVTPPNRPYPSSAPATPTPMLSAQGGGAGAASPGGLVVNNPAADGRQKKSWLGKIFKKLQAHVPEDHHPHWPHRHHNDSTNNAQPARPSGAGAAASSGDRNRARATTPPAGARRSNNDRDRTQRHRSSDPRPASSGPGNRDRSNAARSGNRRTSPQGSGPDNSLCEFFMRGECPNGRLCPYRHPGEETLHGCSPRTIARTIRRACRENENGGSENTDNANRGSSAAEGAATSRSARRSGGSGEATAAGRSSGDADRADRAARRRASTGTTQSGSGGSPQGASGSGAAAAAAPARPKRQVKLGLDENELEMLPSFPFKPLTEAEAAEDDHRPTECHICYEDFEEGVDVRVLPCFHMFHSTCVGLWLKKHKTCPFCQTEVKLEAEA